MDSYYFNMIMIELDGHLKDGNMESAIRSYEKLTGTFERLDIERQQQLVTAVIGMAKRIGLEVHI
jgi:outer membrane protein assembly factor BamD (BamD/ComL family)